ncbi:MAG: eight-cysteine-cluster domain-containing protein [Candidatus Micrarchaeia archaeon]
MRTFSALAILALLVVAGCLQAPPANGTNQTVPPGYEVKDYCKTNDDCVRQQSCCDCGLGVYVNRFNYNSSPCTGPVCKCAIRDSKGECQGNKCVAVDVPPPENNTSTTPPGYEVKDYCRKDSDCVRLNRCCDCGMGEYVNVYNQQPECPPGQPRCMCPTALSEGRCVENRCTASQTKPPAEQTFKLTGSYGGCGGAVAPQSTYTSDGMVLNGSINAPSPCYKVVGYLTKSDEKWVLNLTTESAPSNTGYCPQCSGTIYWTAEAGGYSGPFEVYYYGKKVFPAKAGFCGTETKAACAKDSDCVSGGCSGQVCQGKAEEPVVTTCEYRTCYDASAAGVRCGCVQGMCRWN